jgi:hypothetical protein
MRKPSRGIRSMPNRVLTAHHCGVGLPRSEGGRGGNEGQECKTVHVKGRTLAGKGGQRRVNMAEILSVHTQI